VTRERSNDLTGSPEHLRLGIDMDGVLADFNTGWMERYNRSFGTELHHSQVVDWDGLHGLTHFPSMDEFWAWAQEGDQSIFRELPPFPGAVDAIERLNQQHRVVIVSSKFDWAIPDTLAWLAEHRVAAREIHFVWDKTTVPCDVYLEDAPHHLDALVARRPDATICRMVRPWNRAVPGAIDVAGWEAFAGLVDGLARSIPGRHTG
jgi:5'(3')-deoxyribonucleotidase